VTCYINASSQQEGATAHIENSAVHYFNILDKVRHVL
jgi:hypothetical protein